MKLFFLDYNSTMMSIDDLLDDIYEYINHDLSLRHGHFEIDDRELCQKIVKMSIVFLKEHTIISNTLHDILARNISADIINMIIEYTVEKADPQEVLETSIENPVLSINGYTEEELQEFISEGWNINSLGKYDQGYCHHKRKSTPLIEACEYGQYDRIKFYLKHGANAAIKDDYGNDGLTYLKWYYDTSLHERRYF